MELINKLKIMTGESDEELLSLILSNAEGYILGYTNRSKMLPKLECIQIDIALAMYNKMGTEGEQSHSEGGISVSLEDLPTRTATVLNNYRLARVSGREFTSQND